MATRPQLSARNLTLGDSARAFVHKYVAKLELFYDRINSCRVMIDVPHRFTTGEAFDAAGRQLQDYVRRQREDISPPYDP